MFVVEAPVEEAHRAFESHECAQVATVDNGYGNLQPGAFVNRAPGNFSHVRKRV